MNTHQITKVLASDNYTNPSFRGVFSRDHFISEQILYPGLYICNTDNSDSPGEHWVLIYFISPDYCEYFDSYGLPPWHKDLLQKLSMNAALTSYSNTPLQGLSTTVCGQYCLIYALFRLRNYSRDYIINLLRDAVTTEMRDHVVHAFINLHYNAIITNYKLLDVHTQNSKSLCSYKIQ